MTAPPVRFEALIDEYHGEIYRYLWRLLATAGWYDPDGESQDLAQEVFVRAYRAFPRLRTDSNHRAWLYKIATNCAYSALKQNRREGGYTLPLEDELEQIPDGAAVRDLAQPQSPYQHVVVSETLTAVRRAITLLPTKQRAAIVLRYIEELSYAEIAETLECSEDSARANVYQGLRRLRQELGGEQWTDES